MLTVPSVSSISLIEDGPVVVLATRPTSWKDISHSITVDFGPSEGSFTLKQHDRLRRRQISSSTTSTRSASNPIFKSTPLGTFSAAGPTSSAVDSFYSSLPPSLSTSMLSTTSPPNYSWNIDSVSSSASSTSISFPLAPSATPRTTSSNNDSLLKLLDQQILSSVDGVTLTCKNCTLSGSLGLSHGSYTMTTTNSTSNSTNNIIEFFQHGYVQMTTHDLAAHIEYQALMKPAETLKSYTARLPPIRLTAFQVCHACHAEPKVTQLILDRSQASVAWVLNSSQNLALASKLTLT